jgi:hypothetical protein
MTTNHEDSNLAAIDLDERTGANAVASLVMRGDLSGLGPEDRARYYVAVCEGLGLNPHSQPFAFLRLNGKEVLYATRGCTDQLARIHRVTRTIVDGPKLVDLGGTKLILCVAQASHPNGRVETSTATVPFVDPVNVLMKAETKAKRRVTLSLLGLGMLDEMELETIPAGAQEPGGGVDISRAAPQLPPPAPQPTALDGYRSDLALAKCLHDATEDYRLRSKALHAEEATTKASEALAEWLDAGGYVLTATEQRACERGDYPREMLDVLDAVAECASGADVVRWWGQTAHVVEALGAHAKAAKLIVAKTYCARIGDTSKSPAKVFAAALAPKPPPTGTDSPTSARNDTATGDATPAEAPASTEAQASIARVGDPLAYLAGKATFTEVERAVVAHGAYVPALAAAAVARLEALGEGGDESNRARLVAAWVSESASRAQRAERTASQVRRAA